MRWMILASILTLAMIIGVLFAFNLDTVLDETEQKTRVAMIMTGLREDHSWNESHFDALQKAEKDLNLEVAYYENVPADSTAQSIMIPDCVRSALAKRNSWWRETTPKSSFFMRQDFSLRRISRRSLVASTNCVTFRES